MSKTANEFFYPSNIQEFFGLLNRFEVADIFSCEAGQIMEQHGRALTLPKIIVSMDKLTEMHSINRTERYIEIGSMVNINQIFRLGKIIPLALRWTLDNLYSRLLRKTLSLGGVICQTSCFDPLTAPLVALDARYELRTNTQSRWISAVRLTCPDKADVFHPREILYRVRIPLEQWDFTLCRRFEAINRDETGNGVIVFLARIQNDILSDVRVVYSGEGILRDRNCETSLIGKKLPLARKDAAAFTNLWKNRIDENYPPFLRSRIFSFIEKTIMHFAD
ncbi:MAG: FAD binding domain-containing protein [Spirochaetaceae bacterium]|nr:FAD binding domain-containing protein [Spirochaetaceae bacterium]